MFAKLALVMDASSLKKYIVLSDLVCDDQLLALWQDAG
jgi:hypothetical protein